jgi:hypothetical protein
VVNRNSSCKVEGNFGSQAKIEFTETYIKCPNSSSQVAVKWVSQLVALAGSLWLLL